MPLGLVGAGGAQGGQDALAELLKRRFAEKQYQQQEADRQQQFGLQQRQVGMQEQGMLRDDQRADESLNLQRSTAAAAAQNLAETKATAETKRGQLVALMNDPKTPPQVRLMLQAQAAGANVNSVKDFEQTPEKPEPAGSDFSQFLNRYAAKLGKTAQTLTADDEVAARKAYGQADDRPQSTLGIIVQGPNGPLNVDRGSNTARPVMMDGSPVGKAASPGQAESLSQIEQSLSILDELRGLKKDEWLGPLQGRLTEGKIGIPGVDIPSDLAQFAAQTATLKNTVIKAITGSAMSAGEADRIMAQLPKFSDKPIVWKENLEATVKNLMKIHDSSLKGTGVTTMGSGAQPKAQTAPTQERSVSMADLQAIAAMNKTTVEQEKARATAAGYVIR